MTAVRPVSAGVELILFCTLAAASPLAYALYTEHVWEDYFITFRHSRNMAEGKGLVFQPGERVHGFTSPLGTVVPGLFHWALRCPDSHVPSLWLFRCLSIAGFVGGGAWLFRMLQDIEECNPFVRWTFAAFYILESKGVAFTVNGQETGLLLFFWGWTWRLMQDDASDWRHLGAAWAGLQWVRPDGCILCAAAALSLVVFAGGANRRSIVLNIIKSATLAAVIYAPWLFFATTYYGTPIPHTVTAKAGYGLPGVAMWTPDLLRKRAEWVLEPICGSFGGWPNELFLILHGIAVGGLALFLLPLGGGAGRMARRCGVAYLILLTYQSFVVSFYWYHPPIAACLFVSLAIASHKAPRSVVLLVAAGVLIELFCSVDADPPAAPTALAACIVVSCMLAAASRRIFARVGTPIAVIGALLVTLALSFEVFRSQQSVVESGNRRVVGEWLRSNVAPDETVYVECLGYIGYFSNARMLDFPGLASPRVVRLRKKLFLWQWELVPFLKPDWCVLRPHEVQLAKNVDYFRSNYVFVKKFSVHDILDSQYAGLPGIGYLRFDAEFHIYRRSVDLPDNRQ